MRRFDVKLVRGPSFIIETTHYTAVEILFWAGVKPDDIYEIVELNPDHII